MARVVVIGASRGIGLEFARVLQARGDQVIATYRDDAGAARLQSEAPLADRRALDITDAEAALRFAQALGPVDRAIINAGVYGPRSYRLAEVSSAEWLTVLETNVVGPLRMAALLQAQVTEVMALLSSRMGSIGQSGGGQPIYRSSKAALNAGMRALALEQGSKPPVMLTLHPGWVRTDMGGAGADIDVATSVAGMVQVIDGAGPAHHGGFFNYTGEVIPW
ncbi:MAG: SDR family NAD(P)-dependent oxidoreductase [Alphaproteobacteria bacterium]|nr:SDR family oxidoreductase [Alphaproteobacteria bacterium]TAD89076.1 MAG: SDR family NAD(P)-dependent oxidoreductase [Alphaproteobacteria bacterium]